MNVSVGTLNLGHGIRYRTPGARAFGVPTRRRRVDGLVRSGADFRVVSEYQPAGDQPAAIDELERRIRAGGA